MNTTDVLVVGLTLWLGALSLFTYSMINKHSHPFIKKSFLAISIFLFVVPIFYIMFVFGIR